MMEGIEVSTPVHLEERVRALQEADNYAEAIQAALQAIPEVISIQQRANGHEATIFSLECTAGSDVREHIASTIVQRGWGLRELRAASVSLEDVFVQLVTSEPVAA